MKIDRFIVVCILFSHFLTAQENYVSRLGRIINLATRKFAPAWQSLQDYKTPGVVPKCKFEI